ncbi:MAG: hypothetical protein EAZ57_11245, partial [Cytophagales bacterium]
MKRTNEQHAFTILRKLYGQFQKASHNQTCFLFFCIFAQKQKTMSKKLIRFDWAVKKLLRNKANF